MDAVLKPREAGKQTVIPNKQNRMKKKRENRRSKLVSNPCENVVGSYGGLMMNRPCYPFSLSSSFYDHRQNQLPPLLPLPTVSSSASVKSRKDRTSREMSNNKTKQTVREEVKKKPTQSTPEFLSTPVVCTTTTSFRSTAMAGSGFGFGTENMDSASWVFNLSPPPSSLPLPRFILCEKMKIKAKLQCRN